MRCWLIAASFLLPSLFPLCASGHSSGGEAAAQQTSDQLLLPVRRSQGVAQDAATTTSQATSATMTVADIAYLLEEELALPPRPAIAVSGATDTALSGAATTRSLALLPLPPPGAIRGGKVWINEATAEELIAVLQIDYQRARKIVKYRELFGPFKSADDLAKVTGIHDAMIELLRDKIGITPTQAGKVERERRHTPEQGSFPASSVSEEQKVGNARTHLHSPELS